VTLPAITSIATSLGARRVAQRVVDLAREHPIESVVVSDAQAVDACARLADTVRVLVEPACGTALAALLDTARIDRFASPLVEVCGGMGVTRARLAQWERDLGLP
jgi:L-serine/L-threonine ammonia-lyase